MKIPKVFIIQADGILFSKMKNFPFFFGFSWKWRHSTEAAAFHCSLSHSKIKRWALEKCRCQRSLRCIQASKHVKLGKCGESVKTIRLWSQLNRLREEIHCDASGETVSGFWHFDDHVSCFAEDMASKNHNVLVVRVALGVFAHGYLLKISGDINIIH